MRYPTALFVAILLTAAAGITPASEIYKSVDANGTVVYSDHLDPLLSQTTVLQLEDPGTPPRELHFCWTNCFTLILDHGVYRRTDGTDESWTVDTFSAKNIVLHRHDAPADWNGYSRDVVYAGAVANDRLIGVTVNGKPTSGIDFSWGSALNTLPGSNAGRDGRVRATPDTSPGNALSTAEAPPPVQAEDQPPLPEDGSLWTPGYWYWRDQGYVWIPGAWVRPPEVGVLWTPAYWSFAGAVFFFHPGHWGPTVGFYGGVNYGYGYFGNGYSGGHWVGNSFAYNSAANHLNPAIAHHTYAESVPVSGSRGVVSYVGGAGSAAPRTAAQPQSRAPSGDKPAMTSAVVRTREQAPKAPESERAATARPVPGAKPASDAAPKSNHVAPIRAAPLKQ